MPSSSRNALNMISFLCVLSAAVVVFVAGLAKAASPMDFAESLAAWRVIPDSVAGLLVPLVISIEILLPLLWLMNMRSLRSSLAIGGALCVFTGLYLLEAILFEPPRCSCFGLLAEAAVHQGNISGVLLRNSVLIVLVAAGAIGTAVTRFEGAPQ